MGTVNLKYMTTNNEIETSLLVAQAQAKSVDFMLDSIFGNKPKQVNTPKVFPFKFYSITMRRPYRRDYKGEGNSLQIDKQDWRLIQLFTQWACHCLYNKRECLFKNDSQGASFNENKRVTFLYCAKAIAEKYV